MICLPASCKHKLREWAKQWSGRTDGLSSKICATTPLLLPCMFDAPSYPWPLQRERESPHRSRTSLITITSVLAVVSGRQNNPTGSSFTAYSALIHLMVMLSCSLFATSLASSAIMAYYTESVHLMLVSLDCNTLFPMIHTCSFTM